MNTVAVGVKAPFVSLTTDTSLPREAYTAQLFNVAKAFDENIFLYKYQKVCYIIFATYSKFNI